MAKRSPTHDTHDVEIGIGGEPSAGQHAWTLVKVTYDITSRGLEVAAPEPLVHDIRDEGTKPRIVAHTDFWQSKLATDVIVQGHAFPQKGNAASHSQVSVRVGNRHKSIDVFGRRLVRFDGARKPCFEPPDDFESVELTYANAYGGIDWRVEVAPEEEGLIEVLADAGHPGLYPRNPFGKGYLVHSEPVEDFELPQLEDPNDRLTPERLITGDPCLWYRQPLPWCFDWIDPIAFPRSIYFSPDADAWYPGPEDASMPEVARGFLSQNYRSGRGTDDLADNWLPLFFQGGSYGMTFERIRGGEPVEVVGMLPQTEVVHFGMPPPVRLTFRIEGREFTVPTTVHHLVIRPTERKAYAVFGAQHELSRAFIPEVHKHIPVAVSVAGDAWHEFQAPPTWTEKLAAAKGMST